MSSQKPPLHVLADDGAALGGYTEALSSFMDTGESGTGKEVVVGGIKA